MRHERKVQIARPGKAAYGTIGRPVKVLTNYFPLRIKPGVKVALYAVEYSPELPDDMFKRKSGIVYEQKVQVLPLLNISELVCTGGNVFGIGAGKEGVHTLKCMDGETERTVTFTFKRAITMERPFTEFHLMFFNTVFRKAMRELKLQWMGRFQYNVDAGAVRQTDTQGLGVFPGYITSVRLLGSEAGNDTSIAVQIDLKHRVLQNKMASDIISEKMRGGGQERMQQCTEYMKGRMVICEHGTRQSYRISDLKWDLNRATYTFQTKDGSTTTIPAYFKKVYNINLEVNSKMPFLVCERKRGNKLVQLYIPAEVAKMTGMDEDMKRNYRIMDSVAKITRLPPQGRLERSREIISTINSKAECKAILSQFGVEINDKFKEVTGRQMDPNEFQVFTDENHAKNMAMRGDKQGGENINLRRINFPHILQRKIIGGVSFERWAVVYAQQDRPAAHDIINALFENASKYQTKINDPLEIVVNSPRPADWVAEVQRALSANPGCQICLAVLPRPMETAGYTELKKLFCGADSRVACPSQCIKVETITKKGQQAAPKLFHQMVCKMGGYVWAVYCPTRGVRTMVVGVDVTPYKNGSLCAFTASFNSHYTRYFSRVQKCESRGVAEGLRVFIKDACNHFYSKAGNKMPDRIVVYRDGVGESQKHNIMDTEIPQFKAALEEINKTWAEGVDKVYVMVNKNINQRFAVQATQEDVAAAAPRGGRGMDRGGRGGAPGGGLQPGQLINPQPLMCFDAGVSADDKFDFYCVHQEVTQGCVTPTHYEVLLWEMPVAQREMTVNDIQMFTQKLAMLYQNWPGPIRVPAPVMYCNRLNRLAKEHVGEKHHVALNTHLYFL